MIGKYISRSLMLTYFFFQACQDICFEHYSCVECVGFKQGSFNDTVCKERCNNLEVVPILYDAGCQTTINIKLKIFNPKTKLTTSKVTYVFFNQENNTLAAYPKTFRNYFNISVKNVLKS